MKKYILKFTPLVCLLLLLGGCSKEDARNDINPQSELIIAPSVGGQTRAAFNYKADDYFSLTGFDKADITVGMASVTYDYNSTTKELRAVGSNIPFRFPADGTSLTFKVQWPTIAQRASLGINLPKDQSTREAFFTSDFLSVKMNALPSVKIPVNLEHEHCKATFTLDGTALYGKKIEKLVFNGYTAYCDPSLNDAQLIFQPLSGQYIFNTNASGALKISGDNTMYSFTLKEHIIGFGPGSHHTIKLNLQN